MDILNRIFGQKKSSPIQGTVASTQQPISSSAGEDYITYILQNYPQAKREDVVAFLRVLDVFDNTNSKRKTLEAFDAFINRLADTNPMHAMMVNGFFCGLLGKNMSLSDNEINSLAQKYTPMIITKLNSQRK